MDGIGIRPAMLEVGERLATHGYFVLLPDSTYDPAAAERHWKTLLALLERLH
jgi:dienelactone hydrolase